MEANRAERWTEEEQYLVAQLAYDFAMQGRYGEAEVLLEGLLAAVPQYEYVRRTLAGLRLHLGKAEAALGLVNAGGAASELTDMRRLRLESLLQLGRTQEAHQEYAALRPRLEPGESLRFALALQVATGN